MYKALVTVCLCCSLLACASNEVRNKEQDLKYADTHVRLAVGYLQQGRVDAALERLLQALDAAPDYPEAHSSIALVYDQLGENEKSIHHFERALKLRPEDGAIHNNYAVSLCRQGKPHEAEKHFLQAIKSRNYRTPARAYENLGVCAMQIPDLDKAETYLRNALQINPKLPAALLQMGRISLQKERYLSGRAYLQRYQEVAPLDPQGLWLGVQVENKLGDTESARKYALQLRKNFPDANETRLMLEAGLDQL